MPSFEAIIIAIFGFFFGLFLVYYGYVSFNHYQVIRDTPTSKIHSLALGESEVKGKIKSYDEAHLYTHPLSDEDVVYYDLEIEEHRENDDGSDWHTVDQKSIGDRFIVRDDTGEIEVYIANPRFEFNDSDTTRQKFTVGPDQDVPDVLEKFKDNSSFSFVPDMLERERYRVTVKCLRPDQDVFVFGQTKRHPSRDSPVNEDNLIITDPSLSITEGGIHITEDMNEASENILKNRGTPFIISTQSEKEIQKEFRWSGPGGFIAGLAISSVSLYFLLSWFVF